MQSSSWDRIAATDHRHSQLAGSPPQPSSSLSSPTLRRRLEELRDFSVLSPCRVVDLSEDHRSIGSMVSSLSLAAPAERVMPATSGEYESLRSAYSSLSSLFASSVSTEASLPPPSLRAFATHDMKLIKKKDELTLVGLDPETPRVTIDNASYDSCTVVTVDDPCGGEYVVPMLNILKSLGLEITKCYLSSDGRYFLHVFHVTDVAGQKIGTPWICYQIEDRLRQTVAKQAAPPACSHDLTAELELTAPYRPNQIPDLVSLLHGLGCTMLSLHYRKIGSRTAAILKVGSTDAQSRPSFFTEVEAAVDEWLAAEEDRPWAYYARVTQCTESMPVERRLFWTAMDELHFHPARLDSVVHKVQVVECKDSGYMLVTVEGQHESLTEVQAVIIATMTDLGYELRHGYVTTDVQEYYVVDREGNEGSAVMESELLERCLRFALFWCSQQGTRHVSSSMADGPKLLAETMASVKNEGLSLTGATWYSDGSASMGRIEVLHGKNSTQGLKERAETESKTKSSEVEKPSLVRRAFGLGGMFLRGVSAALRMHASML